jgi:hypothetical protein
MLIADKDIFKSYAINFPYKELSDINRYAHCKLMVYKKKSTTVVPANLVEVPVWAV